jgi:hypothetical protein
MRLEITALSLILLIGCSARGSAQEPMRMQSRERPPRATRQPEECVGVVAPSDLKNPPPDYRGAERFIVAPPEKIPKALRGEPIHVRYLQTARGTLDSIQVDGISDDKYRSRYIALIQDTFVKGEFRPAVYRSCAVDAWYSYTVTPGRD